MDMSDIKPVARQRVMDLVASAGVDISDWSNYKKGPDFAASNPKYCYEWAFVEPGKTVVLSLWFDHMLQEQGIIRQRHNFRRFAMELDRTDGKANLAKRARALDKAIQDAYREKLPVRVIVCDGDMRNAEDEGSGSSRVHQRMLDPSSWAVTSYDWEAGDVELTRGAKPAAYADQFSVGDQPQPPERVAISGTAYARDPAVRSQALARAKGICELCGEPGFAMEDGRTYLETHHVVALSEGGPDHASNVIALCANDHRKAHYGIDRDAIRSALQSKLAARA